MKTQATPIRVARRRARLSAERLAEQLGCSRAWLLTVERAPGLASPELLERLARVLGESPGSFTGPRIVAGKVS